ncbi:MAG: polyprenyl synthetase family protein, partial [Desulfatitalea sp.]|nr:polyprenyl synthetase family protein [Desulfatitalea sp.]NNK01290.1 polyprenyl synthetase family protein [Desulfatitalea sp.]
LKTVIRGGEFSPTVFERIRVLLAQAGGIEYTRRRAAAHITQAKESLNRFTPSKDRDILHDIADYALERTT